MKEIHLYIHSASCSLGPHFDSRSGSWLYQLRFLVVFLSSLTNIQTGIESWRQPCTHPCISHKFIVHSFPSVPGKVVKYFKQHCYIQSSCLTPTDWTWSKVTMTQNSMKPASVSSCPAGVGNADLHQSWVNLILLRIQWTPTLHEVQIGFYEFPEELTFLHEWPLNIYNQQTLWKQGPSWEANSHSAGQEILRVLWNPKGSLPPSHYPPRGPYPKADQPSPHFHTVFISVLLTNKMTHNIKRRSN
jgi:hypothetical protein